MFIRELSETKAPKELRDFVQRVWDIPLDHLLDKLDGFPEDSREYVRLLFTEMKSGPEAEELADSICVMAGAAFLNRIRKTFDRIEEVNHR